MEQKNIDRLGFGIKAFGAVLGLVIAVLFAISIYGQIRHPKPGPYKPLPPDPLRLYPPPPRPAPRP